jgi:NAD(P)-dependent dehydrogenase (short-subunit alcohol dehydrogenase family)
MMTHKPAVFVTGGSNGLGLKTAEILARHGWNVALFARDAARLAAAAETILADTPNASVRTYAGDVRDFETLQQAVAAFASAHGRLDAVVHAAGRMHAIGPVAQVDPRTWREDLDVSLTGAFHLAKAASPWLEACETGAAFVTFAGPGHHQGLGFASGYAAAQAGLVRFVENLAAERVWPSPAGPSPKGFVGYYAVFPAVTPTGLMDYVLGSTDGRKWLPRFTEMFGEGKEVEPHVPAGMAAWLCQRKPPELSGRVVSGMLDPELTEIRLAILGDGDKGRLRLKF